MARDNRATVEQFIQAMMTNDVEAQDRLLADDFVEEYPQSASASAARTTGARSSRTIRAEHRKRQARPVPPQSRRPSRAREISSPSPVRSHIRTARRGSSSPWSN